MESRVRYERREGVGWIDLDDGKVNALSPAMQAEITAALDEAERDGVVTVIRGRPGTFSAGFDLAVIAAAGPEAQEMVLGGFQLARRILAHPRPVVMACSGHAVAMGVFLLLTGDYRIGIDGDSVLMANEVAIGLTLPRTAIEILRQRLEPAAFVRASLLADRFDPAAGVAAGFLDEIVAAERFEARVAEIAEALAGLDVEAHRATKERVRGPVLGAIDAAIEEDRADSERRVAGSAASAS